MQSPLPTMHAVQIHTFTHYALLLHEFCIHATMYVNTRLNNGILSLLMYILYDCDQL